ncbi:hypothetical protein M3588_26080, partial [Cytobacillus sp. AMY 15.2]|uniref:hypothetical protein n=1 Tax=Cytobacillus sp. AMY 15.2 TaxID=2939563 RepID=UPI0020409750
NSSVYEVNVCPFLAIEKSPPGRLLRTSYHVLFFSSLPIGDNTNSNPFLCGLYIVVSHYLDLSQNVRNLKNINFLVV